MTEQILLASWLKEYHWEDLANLHLDLCYCRHRFIRTVNKKLSSQTIINIETLDQLAKMDEALKAAADNLEAAKTVLFDLCYDSESAVTQSEESEG